MHLWIYVFICFYVYAILCYSVMFFPGGWGGAGAGPASAPARAKKFPPKHPVCARISKHTIENPDLPFRIASINSPRCSDAPVSSSEHRVCFVFCESRTTLNYAKRVETINTHTKNYKQHHNTKNKNTHQPLTSIVLQWALYTRMHSYRPLAGLLGMFLAVQEMEFASL